METGAAGLHERLQAALGGAYTLERELGGGGMSRVFVAVETTLGRRVVVKVLPPEATGPVSAGRFRREVQLAAQLRHPHVVPLLSAGEHDGLLYYTMPFVEGESLRTRLARSGELPVADAIKALREVADALAYAHARGVVHRDLKPENILLADAHALVADFGIAKALAASVGSEVTLTSAGVALGTPAYMAPEQAAADPNVDHRADLYALGVIAYEILAGVHPFAGRSPQAILAAHVSEAPEPLSRRRPGTPPALAGLLMALLAKRPADRPQTAGDVLRTLESIALTPAGTSVGDAPADVRVAALPVSHRGPRALPWIAAGLCATAALVFGIAWARSATARDRSAEGPRRWNLVLPDSAPLAFVGAAALGIGEPAVAISSDGALIAYVAETRGTSALYVRRLDSFDATPVPGSDGAFAPFVSPDGKWVAFFAGAELRKVAVRGGRPVSLAQVEEPSGGAWLEDGRIMVSESQGLRLAFVPEAGGTPQRLAYPLRQRIALPQPIPGRRVLSSRGRTIITTSLETGAQRALTRAGLVPLDSLHPDAAIYGANARYLPSGHIVYASSGEDGVLMALPFDIERGRALGPPVPVLQGVRQEAELGATQLAVSASGTLVYAPGLNAGRAHLVVRDQRGRVDTLPFPQADYGEFRVSPDGRRIIARLWPPGAPVELWHLDRDRGTATRVELGFIPASYGGTWWPDGQTIVVAGGPTAARREYLSVRVSPLGGALRDTIWLGGVVHAVSPDGGAVAFTPELLRRLSLAPRTSGVSRAVLVDADGTFPCFSPDGRWLAYTTRRSGRSEVYVASVSDPRDQHQVSVAGGEEPVWSRRGDEIIYRNGRQWYAVTVATGGRAVTFGRPRPLFEGPYLNVTGISHDLLPADQGHVLLLGPPETTTTRLNVVTNWFAELRRLAPPARH